MNALKAVLFTEMDAMSKHMDCRHKLAAIRFITGLAIDDLNKALDYEREVNKQIEGQLKLWRTRAICK